MRKMRSEPTVRHRSEGVNERTYNHSSRSNKRTDLGAYSPASSESTHDNRWSEIIPPNTALTFAAIWDPEDGMVTFSGGALLHDIDASDPPSGNYEAYFNDSYNGSYGRLTSAPPPPRTVFNSNVRLEEDLRSSQVLSVTDANSFGPSENTATLGVFLDAHRWLSTSRNPSKRSSRSSRMRRGLTQTSSTLDGMDIYCYRNVNVGGVYSSGSLARNYSCLNRLDEIQFDAGDAFATFKQCSHLQCNGDECGRRERPRGRCQVRESHQRKDSAVFLENGLKSAFSTTTTSTSSYVEVGLAEDDQQSWQTVPPSNFRTFSQLYESQPVLGYAHPAGRRSSSPSSTKPSKAKMTTKTKEKPRNRLRKRSRLTSFVDLPARASQVLARETYNHVNPESASTTSKSSSSYMSSSRMTVGSSTRRVKNRPSIVLRFIRGLSFAAGSGLGRREEEHWVKVDLSPGGNGLVFCVENFRS